MVVGGAAGPLGTRWIAARMGPGASVGATNICDGARDRRVLACAHAGRFSAPRRQRRIKNGQFPCFGDAARCCRGLPACLARRVQGHHGVPRRIAEHTSVVTHGRGFGGRLALRRRRLVDGTVRSRIDHTESSGWAALSARVRGRCRSVRCSTVTLLRTCNNHATHFRYHRIAHPIKHGRRPVGVTTHARNHVRSTSCRHTMEDF